MPPTLTDLTPFKIDPKYEDILTDIFRPSLFTYVDILIVVDTEISTQPGVGFGIGSVIELIRSTRVGCMRFRVDIAERSGSAPAVVDDPAEFAPRYTGFRFDMSDDGNDVIDKYEQIWCFGFKPDNFGASDANIDQPGAFPTSDAELAKLAAWQKDRKGGIFATGDHDYLGASMCRRIPRIGTMRRWTNADGVPPIGTPDRIDTLRPPSPAYEPGAPGGPLPMNNTPHQGDLAIQPIDWVAWSRHRVSIWFEKVRPHPVLCHPTLGPIDVMPDHAHEGLCRDTGTVPLDGTYNFDGAGEQPEYPNAIGGGARPEPRVIAYGSTLGDPPYNFGKGPQPARSSFPMISVYDGHRAGVGRCATDSTWHHWMDINIAQTKAAGGDNWEKIKRYFINLAVWLNPPGYSTSCLLKVAFESHFSHIGFQEYSPRLSDIALGRAFRDFVIGIYGPCWVWLSVFEIIDIPELVEWRIWEEPHIPKPIPDPCYTCPPFELIELTALGALVRVGFDASRQVHEMARDGRGKCQVELASLEKAARPAIRKALQGLGEKLRKDLARSAKLVDALA